MAPLQPPDTHQLAAAIGWLELGNVAEAEAELERISPSQHNHPDVLEVRWLICVERKQWPAGLQIAQALVRGAPKRCSGWLHRAYALRRVPGGTLQRAWKALLPAFDKFPREPIIAYNLACYACQLQQLEAARTWIKRALILGGQHRIQAMALSDPDLEPLWDEIRAL